MSNYKNKTGLIIGLVFFGAACFYIGERFSSGSTNTTCVSNLYFIKKNIDCDTYDESLEKLSKLQERLNTIAGGYEKTKKIKRMSIFVRDLNTSRFAGYNENDVYYMASLLKTPILIAGFKLAEVEPKILEQKITYSGLPNLYAEQSIKPSKNLIAGENYTILDLMERSVVESDNTASQLLYDYYPPEFIDRIQQALGIQVTRPTGETENLITARIYSNVFRILFNSSYLTKEYSNQALDILSRTNFSDGLTSKLPKNITISHKFAERTLVNNDGSVVIRQFHECGIVYAENGRKPYSVCIMTEGDDYKDLEEVIADTSQIIYDEMIRD